MGIKDNVYIDPTIGYPNNTEVKYAPWLDTTSNVSIPMQVMLHRLKEIDEDKLAKLIKGHKIWSISNRELEDYKKLLISFETIFVKINEIISAWPPLFDIQRFDNCTSLRNEVCDEITYCAYMIYYNLNRQDNGN